MYLTDEELDSGIILFNPSSINTTKPGDTIVNGTISEDEKFKIPSSDKFHKIDPLTGLQIDEKDDEALECQEKLDEIIANLKEPCKSIFDLYYDKRFSLAEIASKLGYKDVTVAKTQKYRCMEKVKSCLRPFYKVL